VDDRRLASSLVAPFNPPSGSRMLATKDMRLRRLKKTLH
jgi:hypothetical protein